jgi:hypothetical protein
MLHHYKSSTGVVNERERETERERERGREMGRITAESGVDRT